MLFNTIHAFNTIHVIAIIIIITRSNITAVDAGPWSRVMPIKGSRGIRGNRGGIYNVNHDNAIHDNPIHDNANEQQQSEVNRHGEGKEGVEVKGVEGEDLGTQTSEGNYSQDGTTLPPLPSAKIGK